ncbi:site-specific integrase [Sphingosinicella sp. LY1275]|uniref:tyrosine-type recombinase/integrase n=1 Tax=Sphingosinicella sp. LY1275 TaxID=3095379 RepID=UPI002ADEA5DD|nr:site-specific integrase [Sphingosinicella sp. LY1275]MEA1015149.1 site-specific integrase [Sphingosinicella sp. LY1275]
MSDYEQPSRTGRMSMRLDGKPLGPARASRETPARSSRNDEDSGSGGKDRRSGGPAKILDEEQQARVLRYIDANSKVPESDKLKVLLSFKAGLRACEIAALTVDDVVDADGRLAPYIRIRAEVSKSGRARMVPMSRAVEDAIRAFRNRYPNHERFAVGAAAGRKTRYQNANAVTVWFWTTYRKVGLQASSHSGRRTFITKLARNIHQTRNSLRDVQLIAGHARLDTTQSYIEPEENLTRLIELVDGPPAPGRQNGGRL